MTEIITKMIIKVGELYPNDWNLKMATMHIGILGD